MNEQEVYKFLSTVMDPELNVDIVSLGLIYEVSFYPVQTPQGTQNRLHIIMTLTTPGCPLAGVFDGMLRDALRPLPTLDVDQDVSIELTFDPPWTPDMMSAEARAELGFD
jgi:metal-sulfur cluster biosynthetic enzyme